MDKPYMVIDAMEYYSALKKKEILSHATTPHDMLPLATVITGPLFSIYYQILG